MDCVEDPMGGGSLVGSGGPRIGGGGAHELVGKLVFDVFVCLFHVSTHACFISIMVVLFFVLGDARVQRKKREYCVVLNP